MSVGFINASAAVNMIGTGSQNEGMSAVPVPGEVAIDGDLSDWDTSGRILMFADKSISDTYCAEVSAMYDEDNYYLAFNFKDPSPMSNIMDPIKESLWTWKGDSVQLRMKTDQTIWVTLAYYNEGDQSSIEFDYWHNMDDSDLGMDRAMYVSEEGSNILDITLIIDGNPKFYKGLEQKFKENEAGDGYVQEVKIPWEYIYKSGSPIKSGVTEMSMGIEAYWGDPTGTVYHEYSYKDNMAPGKTKREFYYTSPDVWGKVNFSKNGNLPLREYIPDAEVTGSIEIELEIPKNAKYVTITADNENGERISNIASEIEADQYVVMEKENTKIIRYGWNGLDIYDKMVEPGTYTIKGITHEGIEPFYDTVFYNPGNPPWPTADGTGDWGSDHQPPTAVASYGDMTYVGWPMAEGGHALIGIGGDGKKVWGENRGARMMAANEKYLYALPDGSFYLDSLASGNTYIMRVDRLNGDFKPFVYNGKERKLEYTLCEALEIGGSIAPSVCGMAADDENLYVATSKANNFNSVFGGKVMNFVSCINVLDAETGKLKKRIEVPNIGSIALAGKGRVYAVTGNNLCEVNIGSGRIKHIDIKKDKDFSMGAIAVDSKGNIGIYDKGKSSQVKVYTKDGKFLYAAGKEGGRPLVGDFDKEGMIKVMSIAFDHEDNIWAVEHWNYPRRVSVWGRDGKLVRDYIGNTGYSAAGAFLHDSDPEKAYVGPVEMKLDRENGGWEVTRILWVADSQEGTSFNLDVSSNVSIQHFTSSASGKEREYMFQPSYSSRRNSADVLFMEYDDGYFRPVFAVGMLGSLYSREMMVENISEPSVEDDVFGDNGKEFAGLNTLSDQQMFMWNDLNSNGKVEFSECTIFTDPSIMDYRSWAEPKSFPLLNGWGSEMTSDLRFINITDNRRGCIYAPEYFLESGAPVYTANSMRHLTEGDDLYIFENVLIDGTSKVLSVSSEYKNNETKSQGIKVVDYDKNGKRLWFYKNDHPGVAGSHTAAMQTPGTVLGPIKMMGIADIDDGGEVFALRGNLGCDYIMTTDGYYVQTLFRDGRLPRQNLPETVEEAQGMSMKNLTEGGEPFSGWFGRQADGAYRMVVSVGGRCAVVARIEGLETIKRFVPVKRTLTEREITDAAAFNAKMAKAGQQTESKEETKKDTTYEIAYLTNQVSIDGDLSDWAEIPSLAISKTGAAEKATAKLAWDDTNLYASFAVTDETPMLNTGKDYTRLFKTGDSVDVSLSPSGNNSQGAVQGDMRIVISKYNDKPTAVMMKETDATATAADNFSYSSPVTTVPFDRVSILDNAEINIKSEGNVYVVEARIPLADIGLTPENGLEITGDMGIITSDSMGTINIGRIYYFNKTTELTNDMPTEAKLYPERWGKMKFTK